jgi:hypothetical protein
MLRWKYIYGIFSTNYDLCIETFCEQNKVKKCIDGFRLHWDVEELRRNDADVVLYKIHGSVRWYRTEEGDYEASMIYFKDTKVRLDSGQEAVPLILYPGKKFEYFEPMFDLLSGLKKRLNHVNYIFVIGYSFKDRHLADIFRYAAKRNPHMIILLIDPNAHAIYQNILKSHIDNDFQHGFDHEGYDEVGFDVDRPSKLKGRVICLPYRIDKVIDQLLHKYLGSLVNGQLCENAKISEEPANKTIERQTRWDECLKYYAECEHIEKIKELTDNKLDWPILMKIDYVLGTEIIVKSFLNNLFWESGRKEWLNRFNEYSPITPDKIRIKIDNETLYIESKQRSDRLFYGENAFLLYNHLLKIYDNHLIFSNEGASKTADNNGLKINQILEYLSLWKQNIPLRDYPNRRRKRYLTEFNH